MPGNSGKHTKGASIKDVRGQGGGGVSQKWTNSDKGRGGSGQNGRPFYQSSGSRSHFNFEGRFGLRLNGKLPWTDFINLNTRNTFFLPIFHYSFYQKKSSRGGVNLGGRSFMGGLRPNGQTRTRGGGGQRSPIFLGRPLWMPPKCIAQCT